MAKIILEGCNEGFDKVSFTKIQIDMLEKSLKESKEKTDLFLEDNVIMLETGNLESIQDFISEAIRIGVAKVQVEP